MFIIHNKHTKDVYGTLVDNCTTNDRDNYIKGLVNLHKIIDEVSASLHNRSGSSGNEKPYTAFINTLSQFKSILGGPFILHHSSALYGDLLALFMIMSESALNPKIPRIIPYFSHNMSTLFV